MGIALITYVGLPELTEDDRRLLEPLRTRGLRPRAVVWDDPGVEWECFRLAVMRTTWDYFLKPAERVLAATPGRTLYARVDVATGPDGTPLYVSR